MRIRLIGMGVTVLLLGSCAKEPQHACTARRAYWRHPHNFEYLGPAHNTLSLTASGAVYWNGQLVSWPTLRSYLAESHRLNPEPPVFLETEMGVPCDLVERIRDEVDKRMACKTGGRCDEGIYSVWRSLPTPPGTPPS